MKAILQVNADDLPPGTTINIAEFIEIGHYTSHLAYYDLRLTDGRILKMINAYSDLSYS